MYQIISDIDLHDTASALALAVNLMAVTQY